MATVQSFEPLANPNATILILGSMPGVASLNAQQYYAHPRNAFWPIMAELYQIDSHLPYPKRLQALQKIKIALWDVLQQCERQGSLDSAIKVDSQLPNDFVTFFKQHMKIKIIAFNGAKAEKIFMQTVAKQIDLTHYDCVRLPSTSPAYPLPVVEKIKIWRDSLHP